MVPGAGGAMGNGEGLFNEDKFVFFFFLRHEEDVLDLDGVLVENSY